MCEYFDNGMVMSTCACRRELEQKMTDERMLAQEIVRQIEQRIAALEAENAQFRGVDVLITKLSQPCTCQPPGSGTDGQGRGCNKCCKVRVAFQMSVAAVDAPPWARDLMLQMFDAAVLAVREGS
jgi:hypothetical protein